jgi:hypothetical protein
VGEQYQTMHAAKRALFRNSFPIVFPHTVFWEY